MNFKIIFHLDGAGVAIDPADPLHLDALLAWCLAPMQCTQKHLQRDEQPQPVRLPLLQGRANNVAVWKASALFVDGPQLDGLQFWRKRFRAGRIDLTAGSPNLTNGPYRDWNHPLPLILASRLVAWASGSRSETKKVLEKQLVRLGKKRAHGLGKIVKMEFIEEQKDYSWQRDGRAMRWLPHPAGTRRVRPAPPYWNIVGRVNCLEVGDIVEEENT